MPPVKDGEIIGTTFLSAARCGTSMRGNLAKAEGPRCRCPLMLKVSDPTCCTVAHCTTVHQASCRSWHQPDNGWRTVELQTLPSTKRAEIEADIAAMCATAIGHGRLDKGINLHAQRHHHRCVHAGRDPRLGKINDGKPTTGQR
jgi:hypothetical protein